MKSAGSTRHPRTRTAGRMTHVMTVTERVDWRAVCDTQYNVLPPENSLFHVLERRPNNGCPTGVPITPPTSLNAFFGRAPLTILVGHANARSTQACIGLPAKDRPRRPIATADAALVQRLRQGARERDGQEHASRLTASLMGTWSDMHRSGSQMERVNLPGSPCRSYGDTGKQRASERCKT